MITTHMILVAIGVPALAGIVAWFVLGIGTK